ncbi:MAG TPA: hypothetical protein EYH02_00895 [Ignisphaera aggregans]|uniref:Inositol monophosphatase n=1 Tax=Ignisphaera aggregans TaxID=334771 RepID=A0A832Z280_9CREN|nr:hypothetical protein [Ignisphaera aggregans]
MKNPKMLRLIAEHIAISVARFLRLYTPPATVVGEHGGDYIRVFDVEAERRAIKLVSELLPKSIVITEEQGYVELSKDPEYVVLIDPVDGSNNLAANIPWCSTSVAIAPASAHGLGDVVASAVASVFGEFVLSYSVSEGVLYNGEPLKRREKPSNIMVMYADKLEDYSIAYAYTLLYPATRVRILGSVCLDLALLVRGSIEAVIDVRGKLRNTDIAAVYPMLISTGCAVEMSPDASSIRLDKLVSGIMLYAAFSREYMDRVRKAIDYAKELRARIV